MEFFALLSDKLNYDISYKWNNRTIFGAMEVSSVGEIGKPSSNLSLIDYSHLHKNTFWKVINPQLCEQQYMLGSIVLVGNQFIAERDGN